EPTGAEQTPHVIGVVGDLKVVMNQVDDSPTRPQARAIAGRFGSRDDQARQPLSLGGAELRRSPGGRPGAQAGAALASMPPLPSAGGAASRTPTPRHATPRP